LVRNCLIFQGFLRVTEPPGAVNATRAG
jgi:hypothetical protein